MSKVLVVTTSMGTRWESWSQALLRLLVPEWQRVIVDGRTNWSPTGFVGSVIQVDCDYVVHVDEDCFVRSRSGLLSLIAHLDSHPDVVAAGVPDGGHYYREKNPAALNLFFVVFRAQALRSAWSERDLWDRYEFESRWRQDVLTQRPELDNARIDWNETEPYYALYWALLKRRGRFLYLENSLDKHRWSTRVLSPLGEVVAEHLWYLRRWFTSDAMPGHDRANRQRYLDVRAELARENRTSPAFWFILGRMHFERLVRRVGGRARG